MQSELSNREAQPSLDSARSIRRLRIFCRIIALALGAAQAWATRFTMNPDGVSYLDIGDAYWRGDWQSAINAYWSPLYSWILGLFLRVVKPSMYWEYPLVHLVNFLIYVATLAAFEFFLATFVAERRKHNLELLEHGEIGLSESSWWLLGYSLFISSSILLITLHLVTPDMCVAAFVYLASALLLRIRSGTATRGTYVILGIVLGFGYLAKAILFPIGFVFLTTAIVTGEFSRSSLRHAGVAFLVFGTIAGSFIGLLSHRQGHFTFSEVGQVAYEVYVDGVDLFVPGGSEVKHPVQSILDNPRTYQFRMPSRATYALWNNPAYWHQGLKPYLSIKGQLRALGAALLLYLYLMFTFQLGITLPFLALLLMSPSWLSCLRDGIWNCALTAPAICALTLYSLVYTEFRYVAPFFLMLWLAGFSGLRFKHFPRMNRMPELAVMAIAATTVFFIGAPTLRDLWSSRGTTPGYVLAAEEVRRAGIQEGDALAIIAQEPFAEGGAYVARLGRAEIIAETRVPPVGWASNPTLCNNLLIVLRRTGVKAVLSLGKVQLSSEVRSHPLGETDYSLDVLDDSISTRGSLASASRIHRAGAGL
jgi:hypothetical protein